MRIDKKGGSSLGWGRNGGLVRSWPVSTYNLNEDMCKGFPIVLSTHYSYHAATLEDCKQVRWAMAKYLAGWTDEQPNDDNDLPPDKCHSN